MDNKKTENNRKELNPNEMEKQRVAWTMVRATWTTNPVSSV